jgi:hypothetical protein
LENVHPLHYDVHFVMFQKIILRIIGINNHSSPQSSLSFDIAVINNSFGGTGTHWWNPVWFTDSVGVMFSHIFSFFLVHRFTRVGVLKVVSIRAYGTSDISVLVIIVTTLRALPQSFFRNA